MNQHKSQNQTQLRAFIHSFIRLVKQPTWSSSWSWESWTDPSTAGIQMRNLFTFKATFHTGGAKFPCDTPTDLHSANTLSLWDFIKKPTASKTKTKKKGVFENFFVLKFHHQDTRIDWKQWKCKTETELSETGASRINSKKGYTRPSPPKTKTSAI